MYSQVSHLYSIWPVYFTCEEYHADDSLGPVHGMVPYLWIALEELYSTFFWRVCWHSTVHRFLELAAQYGSFDQYSQRTESPLHQYSPWINNLKAGYRPLQAESPLHQYSPRINSLKVQYMAADMYDSLKGQCHEIF